MNPRWDRVIPAPRVIEPLDGFFTWDDTIALLLESGNEADAFGAERLLEACGVRGIPSPAVQAEDSALARGKRQVILAGRFDRHGALSSSLRELGIGQQPSIGAEGYRLWVTSDRILLAAETSAGIYYGFQTLCRLLPEEGESGIPGVRIVDSPGLEHRGISIDFARGAVLTLDAAKAVVREIAAYKLNTLVLYLENAFAFPSHPDAGGPRDRLTPAEARVLDAYARRHHVTVIPSVDSPGHMERFLADPRYAHLAEGDETPRQRAVIDVANPESYRFLEQVYGGVSDAFAAPYHCVLGDEAFGLGTGRNRERADREGRAQLFVGHIRKVHEILGASGKRIMVTADPFEPGFFSAFGIENYGIEPMNLLPRDAIVIPWHYNRMDSFEFGDVLDGMGFESFPWSAFGDWNGVFPYVTGAIENIESYTPHAHRLRSFGTLCSSWGDRNGFFEYNRPLVALFSEWAWRRDGRPSETLLPAAVESLFGAGTASLAPAFRFLGDIQRFLGWSVIGLESSGYRCFFDPVEPRPLAPEHAGLVAEFRAGTAGARQAVETARASVRRNAEYLDYLAFALDQYTTMAEIVVCRHGMSRDDPATSARLPTLRRTVGALRERYAELWRRSRRPLGLGPNLRAFHALERSIPR